MCRSCKHVRRNVGFGSVSEIGARIARNPIPRPVSTAEPVVSEPASAEEVVNGEEVATAVLAGHLAFKGEMDVPPEEDGGW